MNDTIRRIIYHTHDRFSHKENRELLIEFLQLCFKENSEIESYLNVLLEYVDNTANDSTLITKSVILTIKNNFPDVHDKVIKEQLLRKREIDYFKQLRGIE